MSTPNRIQKITQQAMRPLVARAFSPANDEGSTTDHVLSSRTPRLLRALVSSLPSSICLACCCCFSRRVISDGRAASAAVQQVDFNRFGVFSSFLSRKTKKSAIHGSNSSRLSLRAAAGSAKRNNRTDAHEEQPNKSLMNYVPADEGEEGGAGN